MSWRSSVTGSVRESVSVTCLNSSAKRSRGRLDPGDAQLLARYERWRSLDSFMVALATDGLTRLFGVPGRTASAIRRLGMGAVQRTPTLKHWFMEEARGMNGELPQLLRA